MIRHDYRWLVVFGSNLLLLWLGGLANNYLARFSFLWIEHCTVSLYLGGLLVTYSALRLDPRHGWASTLLTGLAADSMTALPFGTSLVLYGLVHAILLQGRRRFPREELAFAIVVALLANLFLFITISFLLVGGNPHPAGAWLRLFSDLLASQIAVALLTGWFMALQNGIFVFLRQHPETGRRVAS
jgi:rod shape-determining protein MreD